MSSAPRWVSEPIADLLGSRGDMVSTYLLHARRLVNRGLICNTLGNVAVRVRDDRIPGGEGLLTKRRGVSLEEVSVDDLVVTDVSRFVLYAGDIPPSGGHRLNQRIFSAHGEDGTNAVVHSHPDIVIGLLSQLDEGEFDYVSVDTAIVLGGQPKIFAYGVNPETDADLIDDEDLLATCMLMPNHGLTTVGRSLAEAYHRHTSMVAEANRFFTALLASRALGRGLRTISTAETDQLYRLGATFLYGDSKVADEPETIRK